MQDEASRKQYQTCGLLPGAGVADVEVRVELNPSGFQNLTGFPGMFRI